MNKLFVLIIGILILWSSADVGAGQPPETPIIRLHTDLHAARILDIAASPDGKFLITASADKTAKLWEASSGKLLKTFRPPVGAGPEGVLHAVTLSPDATLVATAGLTGASWDGNYCVYLFDAATGEVRQRLTGFPLPVKRLAFSLDGRLLAVGLHNSGGVYLIRLADGKRVLADTSIQGTCFGLIFDHSGDLIIGTDGGLIKRYTSSGRQIYAIQTEDHRKIKDMSLSPDGKQLALAYGDFHQVELRTAADGRLDKLLQRPGGRFLSVVWSWDGKRLMAAGHNKYLDDRKLLVVWSLPEGVPEEFDVLPTKNGINALLSLSNGSVAFVSSLSGFGLLRFDGVQTVLSNETGGCGKKQGMRGIAVVERQPQYFLAIAAVDFKKNHDVFRISPDASSVLFSYERYGQASARFDLIKRKLVTVNPETEGLLPHRLTANGIDVQNWDGGEQPRLNRVPLSGFFAQELSQSLTVRHDDAGFMLGTNHFIRCYTRKGRLLWKRKTPFAVCDIALSADDRTLVAALDDGSIRWYRALDGKEQYAFFPHPDRRRWMLWTPDGFFDYGRSSENLIGFQINRGADQAALMVGSDRMFDLLYRPDLLDKAIAGESLAPYLNYLKLRSSKKLPPIVVTNQGLQEEKERQERVAGELQARRKVEEDRLARAAKAADEQREQRALDQSAAEQKVRAPSETERETRIKAEQAVLLTKPPIHLDESDQESGVVQSVAMVPDPSEAKLALTGLVSAATLPPRVKFVTVSGASKQRDMLLQAELCDSGGGVGDVTLFLNKMPIAFNQNGRGLIARSKDARSVCIKFERLITLAPGENTISIMAFNGANSIESERDQIVVRFDDPEPTKPRLHLLTIAVNRYYEGGMGLKYSVNDAEALVKLIVKKAQSLFAGVETYHLYDEQVTRSGLENIFARISSKVERGDVFLLFMAGHGSTDEFDGMYYFLPADFRSDDLTSLARHGISMNDFKKYISSIKAMKSLFLIDTCSSGAFSEGMAAQENTEQMALHKLARSVGRATLAASSRRQVALEGYEGHGVFSYALLQGLGGSAANKKGRITITNLALFVEETLPELTYKKWGYEQMPQKTLIGSDFPIGIK
jgi:WD40 repeat protein